MVDALENFTNSSNVCIYCGCNFFREYSEAINKPWWIHLLPFIILLPTTLHGSAGRKWLYYFLQCTVSNIALLSTTASTSHNSKLNFRMTAFAPKADINLQIYFTYGDL